MMAMMYLLRLSVGAGEDSNELTAPAVAMLYELSVVTLKATTYTKRYPYQ